MGKEAFRQNAQLVESTVRLLDLLLILIAFLLANVIREGTLEVTSEQLLLIVSSLFCAHVVFTLTGLYQRWRGKSIWSEIGALIVAFSFMLLVLGLLFFLSKTGHEFSRVWVALSFSLGLAFTAASRAIIRQVARWRRRNGFNTRSLLLVGGGGLGTRIVDNLVENTWAGIDVVGYVDDATSGRTLDAGFVPRLGDIDDVADVVERHRVQGRPIDYVWIALPSEERSKVAETIDSLQDSAASVSVVPDLFDVQLMNARLDTFVGVPLVNVSQAGIYGIDGIVKRALDVVLAATVLMVTSPLLFLIAALVKASGPGPIIFAQRRYGIDGREIKVWKFRSMSVLENGDTVNQATRHDARVTTVGRFLRKTSLDELPQFFNVLQGSMSVVGPRPHAVAHNEFYRKRIKGYMKRHVIRPGITGLAQVSGCRGQTETEEKMSKRIEYDLSYISRWSLGLDLKIIVLTLREVFFPKNVF